ncbi:MAG: carbohydrate-binding domain-containing protein, partial [Eubacteriales bacterium]|nr:carbohydrate-binding domain-containing protein [Eubacteriales bacterium]
EGVAKLSTTGNKLTLTATKYVDNFELSGTANDLTISVDAFDDADIKLCGLTITNDGTKATIDDCIRINNKCGDKPVLDVNGNPSYDTAGNPITEKIVPTVSVSAKDGTENNLTVKQTGGKAIQCETKLELKGHGILNMDTVSTSIDARAKLYIRNLTLNIKSGNRGIDTKVDTVDEYGQPDEEYSNIEFGGNATVSINSTDDGIRCKNMEFTAIDTALGDTDSILTIVSGADAIQLEGKKGLTMCQGKVTLTGAKKNLNNKSALVTLSGTAKLVDADGNSLA